MADALGDVTKSQVHRLFEKGMPRHSVEAARVWRLNNLELSRTADSRIDRPQPSASNAPRAAVGGLASAAGAGGGDTPPASGTEDEETSADEHTAAYRADRARNERIKADKAELELAQLRGDLVAVRDVRELEFTAGRITRDRVLMVPARVAADLHAQVTQLVPEEHREAFAKAFTVHALERRLEDDLRAALAEAAKAIEEANTDDDDAD